jgi:hypothetical protein
MAVDVQQLFNVELPAQLAKFPDAAKQIGATFQLNITGEGGGSWFIDVSSTGPSVVAGEKPADCTITLTSEAFGELLANPRPTASGSSSPAHSRSPATPCSRRS